MQIRALGRGTNMDRRTFVIEAGKAFPVVIGALYVIGCGDNSTAPSAYAAVSATSTTVNGHNHTVGIPASDQQKPADTTYTSSSTLDHAHMVRLTASQLSGLGLGGSVTVTSTSSPVTGNHSHDFTFTGKKG
jgi:hypothetical protein